MSLPEDFDEWTLKARYESVVEELRKMGQNNSSNRGEAWRRILREAVEEAQNLEQIKAILQIMLDDSY